MKKLNVFKHTPVQMKSPSSMDLRLNKTYESKAPSIVKHHKEKLLPKQSKIKITKFFMPLAPDRDLISTTITAQNLKLYYGKRQVDRSGQLKRILNFAKNKLRASLYANHTY